MASPNAVELKMDHVDVGIESGRISRQSREGGSSHMQADRQVCAACGR